MYSNLTYYNVYRKSGAVQKTKRKTWSIIFYSISDIKVSESYTQLFYIFRKYLFQIHFIRLILYFDSRNLTFLGQDEFWRACIQIA